MLVLTKDDIKNCFTMRDAIEADKEALRLYTEGKTQVPLRVNLDLVEQNGQSLYMPAYASGDKASLGVKIVSSYPENYKKGLPNIPATMIVLDPATGVVDAILDGTYLTQLRTGAVQGAATELMSNPESTIGTLIGTGGQASGQLAAMLAVRELTEIRVFDMNRKMVREFCLREQSSYPDVKFIPCEDVKEAVDGSDIITTVTTSKQPTFSADDVKAGAHINGVGSYTPIMKEIPEEIIVKAGTVIFDTSAGVLAEAGDFIDPLMSGAVTEEKYTGELGQVLTGAIQARQSSEEITIFKTVGSAVLDVVTAQKIVANAKEKGLGTEITM